MKDLPHFICAASEDPDTIERRSGVSLDSDVICPSSLFGA